MLGLPSEASPQHLLRPIATRRRHEASCIGHHQLWRDERILAAVYPGPATQLPAARIVGVEQGGGRSVALTVTGTGRGQVQRIQARRLAVLTQVLDEVEAADHPVLTALLEKLLTGVAGDRLSLRRICRLCDEQVCERGAACPVERAIGSKLPSDPEAE